MNEFHWSILLYFTLLHLIRNSLDRSSSFVFDRSILPNMVAPGNTLEPSITETNFVKQALLESIRPDGRSLLESRSISIRFSGELGWVEVTFGSPHSTSSSSTKRSTRVIVSTHATLVSPRPERPYEGFVDVRAEVQPIAANQFERGRANEEEILFERGLDRAIRRGEVVDREALCVVAGQKVWNISLTVHLLSAQGAALDAAILACMIALRHFRRPDISVSSGSQIMQKSSKARKPVLEQQNKPRITIHDPSERVPVPLALHHHPLSVSFAIFDPAHMASSFVSGVGAASNSTVGGNAGATDDEDDSNVIVVADPSPIETTLCTSKLLIVANVQGEVCVLDKSGGRPLSESVINRVIGLARIRVKELNEIMEKALKEDSAQRVIEVV